MTQFPMVGNWVVSALNKRDLLGYNVSVPYKSNLYTTY
jgi:hypothetical protein